MDINNLGVFADIYAVWTAYPAGGKEGDYLFIGADEETGVKYRWNKYDQMWQNAVDVTETPARKVETFDKDVAMQNNLHVAGNLRVDGTLRAKHVRQPNCGLFPTLAKLQAAYPAPAVGMWATVGDTIPGEIYICETEGVWTDSGEEGGIDPVDLTNYVTYPVHNEQVKRLATNVFIDEKHTPNITQGGEYRYDYNVIRDAIWITIPEDATTMTLSGVDLTVPESQEGYYVLYFFYRADGDVGEESYIGRNSTGVLKEGAKMCVVSVFRENNPNYEDLDVSFTYIPDDRVKDVPSMLAARDIYLVRNHLVNVDGQGNHSFIAYEGWDTLLVQYPNNALGFDVRGINAGRVAYCNEVALPTTDVDEEDPEQGGNIIGSNTTHDVPRGTRMLAVNINRASNIEEGETDVDYTKTYVEFEYPSASHDEMEIHRNALVEFNGQEFRRYISHADWDNIWIDVSDSDVVGISWSGITTTTCHFFKSWGVPNDEDGNYLGNNKTGSKPDTAKMAVLNVKHSSNMEEGETEVDYSKFKYNYITKNSGGGSNVKKLMTATVIGSSNNVVIRTRYNNHTDLVIEMAPYSELTEAMVIKAVYMGGKDAETSEIQVVSNRIQAPIDITSPINRHGFYATYGQHGYAALRVQKTAHGISEAGAIYQDETGREFTLIRVKDADNLIFVPAIDTSTAYPTPVWKYGGTNPTTLTKVGSSPAQTLTSFSCYREDVKIQVSTDRKFLADGIEVESGTFDCDEFSVAETLVGYDVVNTQWYPTLQFGDEFVKLHTSYNFHGASVVVNRLIEFLKPIMMGNFYGWQPMLPEKSGYTRYAIIPKSYSKASPFAGSVQIVRHVGDTNGYGLKSFDTLPERVATYLFDETNDKYVVGCAAGHFLTRGESVNAIRVESIPENKRVVNYALAGTPEKFYPVIYDESIQPQLSGGEFIEHSGYMTWFDPSENPDNCKVYWYKTGSTYVVYVDIYAESQNAMPNTVKINLPDYMEGLQFGNEIESDNYQLQSDVVVNGNMLIKAKDTLTGNSGYVVFTLL